MSIFDKVKEIFISPDEDFPDESDLITGNDDNDEEEPIKERELEYQDISQSFQNGKVVNIHARTQLQVVLVIPKRFEELHSIADCLNANKTVVVNLESTKEELGLRILDFLSGVVYANNGTVKKVGQKTYIFTPYNVDVSGELMEQLKHNGL